jgi:hypothetical protein
MTSKSDVDSGRVKTGLRTPFIFRFAQEIPASSAQDLCRLAGISELCTVLPKPRPKPDTRFTKVNAETTDDE